LKALEINDENIMKNGKGIPFKKFKASKVKPIVFFYVPLEIMNLLSKTFFPKCKFKTY